MTTTRKIFLASSAELKDDRREFEVFIHRKNKAWISQGVFLELVLWEDFLDALSATRLQDEYNRAIRACDVFVMLFFTKVGPYTEEEFETAVGQFQATSRPFIFTYFKNAPNSAPRADLQSLWAFQDKLKALGHFQTEYHNAAELLLHFGQQLDKLVASGFIEFKPEQTPSAAPAGTSQQATLTGDGAIAQGAGATAVGAGGVFVGGKNTGNIHTGTRIGGDLVHGDKILGNKVGTQINTGGGAHVGGNVYAGRDFVGRDRIRTQGLAAHDLEALFAPLLLAVVQHAPPDKQAAAVQQVEDLKTEVAKDRNADDSRIGRLLDSLAAMVPGAIGSLVSTFATPLLGAATGSVTTFVLDKLKGN
ncbi:MAG: hypothetical protein IPK02_15645 [Candidatus Accumulibacter sp.]|uniref:Uncharacterized protein n=1 Tax=Candidatus Accumulibacter affinis TaxID=2954384 RepID=A0A935T910_9PROT|nr:hypothetical protein [Candidatus Accumulibacter affinis]